MNFIKQFSNITAVFVLAAFLPLTAQAADEPLPGIILEFCGEILKDSSNAGEDTKDAVRDYQECGREFERCKSGHGLFDDPMSCLVKAGNCGKHAIKDLANVCDEFSDEMEDAYEDAMHDARRSDVETEFQTWLQGGPGSEECLAPALAVGQVCAAGAQ